VQLDSQFRAKGLTIVGFPCNQFGQQEPGSSEEIRQFIDKFGVQFQMASKVDVHGPACHPIFQVLKTACPGGVLHKNTRIKWNFTKFLIGRGLRPIRRYSPSTNPLNLTEDIELALAQVE